MYELVDIKLRLSEEILPYDSNNVGLKKGDWCVVELEKGLDLGVVAGDIKMALEREIKQSLPRVIRVMTAEDNLEFKENARKEEAAYHSCSRMIREKNLPMKLMGAEYYFDRSRILFYFTAEGRVDFRDLVKDLAQLFQARIEMRQVGVRDAARMLGGHGICGRCLCCSSFLKEFSPVTIKMAKDQRLALNPEKLSGLCGRLLCCLAYENEQYLEISRGAPEEGMKVQTAQGPGKIKNVNLLKETVTVELEEGGELALPFSEIKARA